MEFRVTEKDDECEGNSETVSQAKINFLPKLKLWALEPSGFL